MKENLWYKNAIFYEVYLRSFKDSNKDGIGDLEGLTDKIGYLKDLGVDCIWLLPIFVSPRKDDGYDIADYYSIDPEYGTLEQFKQLVREIHAKKMRLVMDLVLNHTSDQHPWFQAAREGPTSPFHDYYVWSDNDQNYKEARIIFIDTERSNWTWDEKAKQYYWHRFYSSQPDLNYENPAVREEMLNVVRFWLDLGIDGFRADAVPYLFEKEGTNCENLPETHHYLKTLRQFVDAHYPNKVLICEANQLPNDVVKYLGNDDEFHLAFHFPLMPKIFMALRTGKKSPIEDVIREIPEIPQNCQWGTFLRNHDELTLEMVTPEEREWMWREYAPDPGMRLNLGIRRRLAPLLDNQQKKIELAYQILLSLPGSPFLYYGDEIGMGDNILLPDRDGVRTPMQWNKGKNGGFSAQEEEKIQMSTEYSPEYVNVLDSFLNKNSLWNHIRKLIQIRKKEKSFETNTLSLIEVANENVLVFLRQNRQKSLLFIHNLGDQAERVEFNDPITPKTSFVDLLSNQAFQFNNSHISMDLKPYQSMYLKPKEI
jgi:maltose alpha-D-glucosyltransferase/alpha-amylase